MSTENPALDTERLDSWYEKGKQLAAQGNSTVWETADWLVEAASFGQLERCCYKQAAAILSLSVGTCRNYTSVAKAFPPQRRVTSEVTFGHYRVVAALPEPEQERLLGATGANRWTVSKLRGEVRKAYDGVPPRKRHRYLSSNQPRQYYSYAHEHVDKWWKVLGRLTSADEIEQALVGMQYLSLQKRPGAAGDLHAMGARLIAMAEKIETLPPPKDIETSGDYSENEGVK